MYVGYVDEEGTKCWLLVVASSQIPKFDLRCLSCSGLGGQSESLRRPNSTSELDYLLSVHIRST